jgi:hypothetical protein
LLGGMAREVLDAAGDESGPAGLVTGAQSAPVVAVKVLVKEDEVFPVRIRTVQPATSVTGPFSRGIGKERFVRLIPSPVPSKWLIASAIEMKCSKNFEAISS